MAYPNTPRTGSIPPASILIFNVDFKLIKMLKRIAVIILPVILLAAGCTKDPSGVVPTNLYGVTNYPNSIDGLNSVLATGYSALRDANMFGFNYLPKAMANCTHAADDGGYDAG